MQLERLLSHWVGALALTGLALMPMASAHEAHKHATGVVAERADLMKEVGEASKQIGDMMKGKTPFEPAVLRSNGAFIAKSGGSTLTALFPAGSQSSTSDALPAIWEDWPSFEDYADQMSKVAKALSATADWQGGLSATPPESKQVLGLAPVAPAPLSDAEIKALAAGPPSAAFEALVKTCNACHTAFRKPR